MAGESVEVTTHNAPTSSRGSRLQILGGDYFYAITRWLILLLLFVIVSLLTSQPILPPTLDSSPIILIAWCYAVFTLVATLALFIEPLGVVRRFATAGDIIAISLFVFAGNEYADLFFPLYLLPLIGLAMQTPPRTSLLIGAITGSAYVVAFLAGSISPEDNSAIPQDALGFLTLGLHAATLVFIPWLAGILAERSSVINRRSVQLAEQETQRAWQEAKSYNDRMRSLYEVAYTLSTTMNYHKVLDVTLIESRKLAPYTAALVLLSTGEPDELYVAASYGLPPGDNGIRVRVDQGPLGQALRSGDPCAIADLSKEPAFAAITGLQSCRAACAVPLRAALSSYGILLVAGNNTFPFTNEQIDMLTALANYTIIALHNAQLVHDLREERAKLLSKEEEVRRQLARDLHDGPAQALAAITMNIEFVKRLLERDPPRVASELDKLSGLAKRTTHEVRTLLFELRPLVLETQGLDTTLRQYFERIESNGTEIVLDSEPIDVNLDTKVEGTLFNIIQESVNNALKHAQANHIWVRLKQTPAVLEATVQDDGNGFDLKKVLSSYEQRGSFGLLNIEERAKLIGGMAELHSAPGQGTTVRVIVPLS
jgi:signal transduction histidine kinase